jgi:hypothetical protein
MLKEAQGIEAFDDISYISDVFISINGYLKDPVTTTMTESKADMIKGLTESALFPIDAKKSEATFDHLSTAQKSSVWFIADRWHLKHTFEGLVPLLALKIEAVEKITPLIKTLGLEYRLLSHLTQGVPRTDGRINMHVEYTTSIRTKAKYITR